MDDSEIKRLLSNEQNFEELLAAFSRIKDRELRNHVLLMIEDVAGGKVKIEAASGG